MTALAGGLSPATAAAVRVSCAACAPGRLGCSGNERTVTRQTDSQPGTEIRPDQIESNQIKPE